MCVCVSVRVYESMWEAQACLARVFWGRAGPHVALGSLKNYDKLQRAKSKKRQSRVREREKEKERKIEKRRKRSRKAGERQRKQRQAEVGKGRERKRERSRERQIERSSHRHSTTRATGNWQRATCNEAGWQAATATAVATHSKPCGAGLVASQGSLPHTQEGRQVRLQIATAFCDCLRQLAVPPNVVRWQRLKMPSPLVLGVAHIFWQSN